MGEGFWRTRISQVSPNEIRIRGYDLTEMIGKYSFGDAVFLLMKGELPVGNEGRMVEAMLLSGCDHSLMAPSTDAVRFVASAGVPLQAAVAAGIIALGDSHGGAIEECARVLQEALGTAPAPGESVGTPPQGLTPEEITAIGREVVARHRVERKRILGYGHPVHTEDPRTGKLLALAREWGIAGAHCELSLAIERELAAGGRAIPLNVDGAIAGIMSDMGLDWRLGKGFYVIARAAGLVAHAHEQMTREKPFRAIPLNEIEYVGPPPRDLPKKAGAPK